MTERLVIIGAGGFGRETHDVLEAVNEVRATFEFLGFLADGGADEDLLARRGVRLLGPVSHLAELAEDVRYVIAIGLGSARRDIDAYTRGLGRQAAVLVHPSAALGRHDVHLGPGTIVCAGAVLTTNVRAGRHVHINLGATVGHDVVIGDYATLSPGVHISGRVQIGAGVLLGTGAAVLPGRTIGDNASVGAQAAVASDVEPGATVVGVPARAR